MRCYLVSTTVTNDDGEKIHCAYAGTSALARAQRDQFITKLSVSKKDVTIEPAEVPLAKADLLEHLNRLLNGEVIAMPEVSKKPAASTTKEKPDAKPTKAATAKKPAVKKPAAKKPAK